MPVLILASLKGWLSLFKPNKKTRLPSLDCLVRLPPSRCVDKTSFFFIFLKKKKRKLYLYGLYKKKKRGKNSVITVPTTRQDNKREMAKVCLPYQLFDCPIASFFVRRRPSLSLLRHYFSVATERHLCQERRHQETSAPISSRLVVHHFIISNPSSYKCSPLHFTFCSSLP